jgi:1-aminocyclopropane-1-carboxylate deaminase
MLYGILDLVRQGAFPGGTRIVAVVTGQPSTPVAE